MFVAISRFTVANDMSDAVQRAFEARPGLVESAPGFVRLDVVRSIACPEEFQLLTYWKDEESYRSWHRGHTYRDSHRGIPKGLKLVPRSARIDFFEHVVS